MQTQNPAVIRAATLQSRFWAHAPRLAPVTDPQIESTPATQLEVEMLAAEQEFLEFDAYLTANPREFCANAAELAADLYANWQCLLAQLETPNR